jgi:hypothetical protein
MERHRRQYEPQNVDVATMWGNALPKGTYDMAYSYSGRLAIRQTSLMAPL